MRAHWGLRRLVPVALMAVGTLGLVRLDPSAGQPRAARWYKGNTHTHTLNSDGDSHPDDVVKWYRAHGYQFVALTDHNVLTTVDGLNAVHGLDNEFLVVRGEEVTDRFGDRPLHINALEPTRLVPPQGGASAVEAVQRDVDAIRAANGVPSINHPNFGWALSADELAQVRNNRLFEIFNGHPMVNNVGGGGKPSLEEMWDAILSRGILLYGLAVDDAHHFKRHDDRTASRPGKGWIYVRADTLSSRALLAAMERGEFYSSTGVELSEVVATTTEVTVAVKATTFSKYRIQFIGRGGRVLQETAEPRATYRVRGDEGYVRARVLESNGDMAWTQPVMLR
ncbi:MAG: CehA/McbA family metallohydrolase [Gemmatimonadetes bacterium]|nr:CehA/McbA family metallohydrolase [Gemmatimonadota bacterium]